MVETFVFGHKSPDSDSITSSLVMANLENELGNNEYIKKAGDKYSLIY